MTSPQLTGFGSIQPGLVALHGNRTETLLETVAAWMRANPLGPLEEEVILVQSNGMAEWVKMQLAQHLGVCAATRVELPARFMWRTYRQVLGKAAVPQRVPLDRASMVWRLMGCLPRLADQPPFAPLTPFVVGQSAAMAYDLSRRLADVLDQYQVYRADWLADWREGQDRLKQANGHTQPLTADQQWQAHLWRNLLQDLAPDQAMAVRPFLHQQVVERLQSGAALKSPVARRVVVFGMTHLPLPVLELLAAVATRSQVLMALPNPCRYHWADIIDGRELHWQTQRRQPLKNDVDLAALPLAALHAHGHPLLAAWGQQGRDFVRQTDAFEEQLAHRTGQAIERIDLFVDNPTSPSPLLWQIQNHILNLEPLAEHTHPKRDPTDRSVVFQVAHSPVRELEILQDHLLDLLAHGAGVAGATGVAAIEPKDIVVMVPQIERFAPAIEAVFGQYGKSDARFIPFAIADLSTKGSSPLVSALEGLLQLPTSRFTLAELRLLIETPAVAQRFGWDEYAVERLMAWCAGAQGRWGLDGAHRDQLGLGECGDTNTLVFALRRMLMGYAQGDVQLGGQGEDQWAEVGADLALGGIEPYGEVGGLDAQCVGGLSDLLDELLAWTATAQTPANPEDWAVRLRQLMAALFEERDIQDQQTVMALEQALVDWLQACEDAGFDQALPLGVVRNAWLEGLDSPHLSKRFKATGVTFCNLMPMRAIPFEVVCLLGMNDGDFPRRSTHNDFDLMGVAGQFRPGDRSRQDDDRQLVLEAILSARQVLYVSWVGKSVRDNTPQPPSVLVAQLRDYVAAGWSKDWLDAITTEHPLQPFSRLYFEENATLHSYAREWRVAHQAPTLATLTNPLADVAMHDAEPGTDMLDPSAEQLVAFYKHPARAYFKAYLGVVFALDAQGDDPDERFVLAGLDHFQLVQTVLDRLASYTGGAITEGDADGLAVRQHYEQAVQQAMARCQREGLLPLGAPGQQAGQALGDELLPPLVAWHGHSQLAAKQFPERKVRCVANRWREKGKTSPYRLKHFLEPWVHSLLAGATQQAFDWVVVGLDGTLHASAWPQARCEAVLQSLITLWHKGQSQALPLPLKTATAVVLGKKEVAEVYEGGFALEGECTDLYWQRCFPDFAGLCQDGQLESLAPQVYGQLLAWIDDCVTLAPHEPIGVAPEQDAGVDA
jgi:exodeoxyribonuclease V gamma subunit